MLTRVAPETSDEDLVLELARDRSSAVLELLMRRHYRRIYVAAQRAVLDPAAADDCAQEAFVRLAASAPRFRPGAAFRPWLDGILSHVVSDARRARGRRVHREAAAPVRSGASGASEAERRLLALEVSAQLGELPEELRVPLTLRFLEERSLEDVARALGCPVGTASSRIRRGLERLRERFAKAGAAGVVSVEAIEEALAAARPGVPGASTILARAAALGRTGSPVKIGAALAVVAGCALLAFAARVRDGSGHGSGAGTSAAGSAALAPGIETAGLVRESAVAAGAAEGERGTGSGAGAESGAGTGTGGATSTSTSTSTSTRGSERHEETRQRAAMLEGRVIERDTGARIAGATVRLLPLGRGFGAMIGTRSNPDADPELGKDFMTEAPEGPETTSDVGGSFHFADLAPEQRKLLACADGHVPMFVTVILSRGWNETEIALPRTGELAVRVADREGAPVEKASVRWRNASAGLFARGALPSESAGRAKGEVAAGMVHVSVAANGFSEVERDVAVGAGARASLDIVLERAEAPASSASVSGSSGAGATPEPSRSSGVLGLFFRGIVLDRHGRPVPGKEVVALGGRPMHPMGHGVSDGAGRFAIRPEIGDADPRYALLRFESTGTEPELKDPANVGQAYANLGDDVTLYFPRAPRITFRLTAPQGAPAPSYARIAFAKGGWEGCEVRSGAVRVDLPPGTYDLAVLTGGYLPAIVRGIELPLETDPPPIEVALSRPARIEGRAIERDGTPVSGAVVARVVPPADAAFADVALEAPTPGDPHQAVADEAGRFALGGLYPDSEVEVAAPGHATAHLKPALEAGRSLAIGDVVLERASPQ